MPEAGEPWACVEGCETPSVEHADLAARALERVVLVIALSQCSKVQKQSARQENKSAGPDRFGPDTT